MTAAPAAVPDADVATNPPKTESRIPPNYLPDPTPVERAAFWTMAVGFVLILAALVGPWFSFVTRVTTLGGSIDDRTFGLFGFFANDAASGVTATVSGNYLPTPSMGVIFNGMLAVTALAATLGFGAVVLAAYLPGRPRLARAAELLAVDAAVLAFVGVILFAVLFPGAAVADGLLPAGGGFLGSSSSAATGGVYTHWTWGPGWAWFVLLAAGALFAVAAFVEWTGHPAEPAATT